MGRHTLTYLPRVCIYIYVYIYGKVSEQQGLEACASTLDCWMCELPSVSLLPASCSANKAPLNCSASAASLILLCLGQQLTCQCRRLLALISFSVGHWLFPRVPVPPPLQGVHPGRDQRQPQVPAVSGAAGSGAAEAGGDRGGGGSSRGAPRGGGGSAGGACAC